MGRLQKYLEYHEIIKYFLSHQGQDLIQLADRHPGFQAAAMLVGCKQDFSSVKLCDSCQRNQRMQQAFFKVLVEELNSESISESFREPAPGHNRALSPGHGQQGLTLNTRAGVV